MDPYSPHTQNLYPQQGYSPYQAYPGYNQPNNTYNMNPNNMGAPRSYGTYTTQSFPQNTLQPSAYASNVSTDTRNSQQNMTYTSFSPNPPPRSYQIPEGAVLDLPEIWELEEGGPPQVSEQLSSSPPPSTGNMPAPYNTNNRFTILPNGNYPTPTYPSKPPEKKERIYIILNGKESSVEVPSNLNGAQLVQMIKKTLSEPVNSLSIPSKGIWEGKDRAHAKHVFLICPESSKYQVKGESICLSIGHDAFYHLYESHGWLSLDEVKKAGGRGGREIRRFAEQWFERYLPEYPKEYVHRFSAYYCLSVKKLSDESPLSYTNPTSPVACELLPGPEYHREIQGFIERIDAIFGEYRKIGSHTVTANNRNRQSIPCNSTQRKNMVREMEKLVDELVTQRNKALPGYSILVIEIIGFLEDVLGDLQRATKKIREYDDVHAKFVEEGFARFDRMRRKIEVESLKDLQFKSDYRKFVEEREKYSCCTKATNCFFHALYCLLCCCVFEGIKDCCDSVTWAPHLSSSDSSTQAVIRQTNISTSYHNQRMNNNFNHNINVTRTGQGTYWN